MTYLVDTDYVVDFLKGRSDAVALLEALEPEGLAISLVTYGEIYEGIYFGANAAAHEEGFRTFLSRVNVLPLNRAIMRLFARLRGDLRSRGQLIGDPDLLIAATAMHHERTLLTRNLTDFRRLRELLIYDAGR